MPWGHVGRWVGPVTPASTTGTSTSTTSMLTGVTAVPGHRPGGCTDEGVTGMAMGDRISSRAEELSGKGK